jgi:hypothetical protein
MGFRHSLAEPRFLLQDQLLDAVHWIRQAVGLACGLLWGAVPLVGAFWIALSVSFSPPSPNLKSSSLLHA